MFRALEGRIPRPFPQEDRMTSGTETLSSADEQRLAELGYKQELRRGWSGFSNFAISFSIISILAGCFTTYGQAWINGGPVAISIGWPVISLMILCVAFSMSELASALPTAGGIYYWASQPRRRRLGLVHRLVQPHRPGRRGRVGGLRGGHASCSRCSASTTCTSSSTSPPPTCTYNAHVTLRAVHRHPAVAHGLINIFSGHLVSMFNRVSVWWHVIGVAVIIVLLLVVPSHHQSPQLRVRAPHQQLQGSATACTGSTCCRSGSC